MNEIEEIIRIASQGDGVTASGLHVAGAVPGDKVSAEGIVEHGPHHIDPPCSLFGKCGGCELQYCDDDTLAEYVQGRVVFVAQSQGLSAPIVAQTHLSPPRSRRRATLHAVNGGGRALLGFRESRSHRIVDLKECHILVPELFALVAPLRAYLSKRKDKYAAEIDLTLTDQGVDCAIRNITIEGLEQTEDLLDFCRDNNLARLGLDLGYGPETFWEPEPATVTLGGVPVSYPSGAFLQATQDAEDVLTSAVREWLGDCTAIADLFAGLGTFAFALSGSAQITAYEAARDAFLACKSAGTRKNARVDAEHRDLFRNPLRAEELAAFDGVILDPPRAGARMQVEQLAQSSVGRIAYVSCNPSSWARDAGILAAGGYELAEIRPVGQFRWSSHVELASLFLKRGE